MEREREREKPLISVIVPIYNAERFLDGTITSVVEQTIGFENIQLILVDDHSTDGSYALAQRWAQKYPDNILLLQTAQNSGTAGAPRNIGLDHAKAPYIMFLDNDDYYFPNACKVLYDAIKNSDADYVQGIYHDTFSDGKEQAVDLAQQQGFPAPGEYELSLSETQIFRCCIPFVWDKIFRTEMFQRHHLRFSEGALGEDDVVASLYAALSEKIAFIPDAIVHYRRHESSITSAVESEGWWRHSIYTSIEFAFHEAERLGVADRYHAIYGSLPHLMHVPYLISKLPRQEAIDLLEKWSAVFKECYLRRYPLHSPESRILLKDIAEENKERLHFDLDILQAMHEERQSELNNIYSSTTWKVAKLLQKLLFWRKEK